MLHMGSAVENHTDVTTSPCGTVGSSESAGKLGFSR